VRWHRELVRLKWARYRKRRMGRPPLPAEVRELILRLAKENPRWGYKRIQGELQKLGIRVSVTAIRKLLARRGLGPAPRRGGTTWRQFLAQQASSMVACDFFTVETVWLKRIYVLVFIELATRRVHLAGCTSNPDRAWMAQQARNFTFDLEEREEPLRFLIHDRDAKFYDPFDEVFATKGLQVIALRSGRLVPTPSASDRSEPLGRSVSTGCLSCPGATSSASSRSTSAITTDSDLTVRCNFNRRSRKSSKGRSSPLMPGWVGEIGSADCCTNTTRQHDGTEFVHPSR
jgi:putative transposase